MRTARPRLRLLVLLILWGCAGPPVAAPAASQETLRVPPGFTIGLFATDLGYARFMTIDPRGTLLVSVPRAGRIIALPDDDGDGRADRTITVVQGLELPHGLAFHGGALYVAETGRVVRLPYDPATRRATGPPVVVVPSLPVRGSHWTRTLTVGPDARLYVSVGSSCNNCEETDARRATILRYEADGSGETKVATGIRNAVGLAFRPGTSELWASVNNRDWLGDDRPAEYLTRIEAGGFYGWPHCHWGIDGQILVDPDLGKTGRCERVSRPTLLYQAHSAPLGIAFYTGSRFPADYRGNLFVALHGSWNRSVATGYKVIRLRLDGPAPRAEDFATGWLASAKAWGRPTDVAVAPDGSLFVSDDTQGVVYRIAYTGK